MAHSTGYHDLPNKTGMKAAPHTNSRSNSGVFSLFRLGDGFGGHREGPPEAGIAAEMLRIWGNGLHHSPAGRNNDRQPLSREERRVVDPILPRSSGPFTGMSKYPQPLPGVHAGSRPTKVMRQPGDPDSAFSGPRPGAFPSGFFLFFRFLPGSPFRIQPPLFELETGRTFSPVCGIGGPARRGMRRQRRSRRSEEDHPVSSQAGRLATLLRTLPAKPTRPCPRRADDDCLQELRWLYGRRNIDEARADLTA